ncbi:MAG TPA: zinc-ribbon domain-containing protein, partial [Thermoanaerobaculia bacterium]|nr:zinc-ribbon domain-containing protein [Thermoanaerobaculia bacterium]
AAAGGPAFCSQCGQKLAPGSRFCPACGAKVGA